MSGDAVGGLLEQSKKARSALLVSGLRAASRDGALRARLAPMFDDDRRRLELAYSLMFMLSGTPFSATATSWAWAYGAKSPSCLACAANSAARPTARRPEGSISASGWPNAIVKRSKHLRARISQER